MARPRRPFSGVDTIAEASDQYFEDTYPGHLGTRQRARWQSDRSLRYSQSNGHEDPLTYLLILDALMSIDPQVELRASYFSVWLNEHYRSLLWEPVTVGRVLSDLCDNFEDVLGVKRGLLERGKDYRGQFYVLHVNPDTAKLAYALRDDLRRLALIEIDVRARFRKTDFKGSPLLECPSVMTEGIEA